MNTVWKYELKLIDGPQMLGMPIDSRILCVDTQEGRPCMWVLVDSRNPKKQRSFQIHGTGHPVVVEGGDYIGTCQTPPFVWHIFEVDSYS